eukprot:m.56728 g.56728  ORF g.56728 m.56728 type:complete len:246 (+) comp34639_c0_seq4:146-883(+)
MTTTCDGESDEEDAHHPPRSKIRGEKFVLPEIRQREGGFWKYQTGTKARSFNFNSASLSTRRNDAHVMLPPSFLQLTSLQICTYPPRRQPLPRFGRPHRVQTWGKALPVPSSLNKQREHCHDGEYGLLYRERCLEQKLKLETEKQMELRKEFEVAKNQCQRNHLRDMRRLEQERERLRVAIRQRIKAELELSKLGQRLPIQAINFSQTRLENCKEATLKQGKLLRNKETEARKKQMDHTIHNNTS